MTKLTPGTYRLSDGTLAKLALTPSGYVVTTPNGMSFITDTDAPGRGWK